MRIEHIAVWAADIEKLRRFYTGYFGFCSGEKYVNLSKGFCSYFLTAPSGGARIELMSRNDICHKPSRSVVTGLAHIAIEAGDRDCVDALTERLRNDGHTIISGPRQTGDGYYESAVADPEGNCVEICAARQDTGGEAH